VRFLEPEQVQVRRGESGHIYATIAGEVTLLDPRFLRVHPLTDPDRHIALRETDPSKGKEFGLLCHWRKLDPESRHIVEAELDRRYLQAVLTQIISVKDYGGVSLCVFNTDRGRREVTLRDIRDNIIYLGSRMLITDADGNRYDIPDVNALDPRSSVLLAKIL
jgi:hypothetical protein